MTWLSQPMRAGCSGEEAEAVELVHANMKNLGIYNIDLKSGSARRLWRIPPADKVFIGGSCGNQRNSRKEFWPMRRLSLS